MIFGVSETDVDAVGRGIRLVAAVAMFAYCCVMLWRFRHGWRVIVPVALWAVNLAGFALATLWLNVAYAPLLGWWSRLVDLHAAATLSLLLWRYFYGRNGYGGK